MRSGGPKELFLGLACTVPNSIVRCFNSITSAWPEDERVRPTTNAKQGWQMERKHGGGGGGGNQRRHCDSHSTCYGSNAALQGDYYLARDTFRSSQSLSYHFSQTPCLFSLYIILTLPAFVQLVQSVYDRQGKNFQAVRLCMQEIFMRKREGRKAEAWHGRPTEARA